MSKDELIIEELYDTYIEKLYRFFFYKVLRKEIAEDLTSQTFLTFVRSIKNGKQVESPRSYLFGIAKHVFLKYLTEKYKKYEQSLDAIEEFEGFVDDTIDEAESDKSMIDLLEKLLPQIPEKQRIILQLRFIDKLSIAEICKKLEKDENYVSTTQKRALQSLRQLLECTDTGTNIST